MIAYSRATLILQIWRANHLLLAFYYTCSSYCSDFSWIILSFFITSLLFLLYILHCNRKGRSYCWFLYCNALPITCTVLKNQGCNIYKYVPYLWQEATSTGYYLFYKLAPQNWGLFAKYWSPVLSNWNPLTYISGSLCQQGKGALYLCYFLAVGLAHESRE